ncbi:MAG TPA: hypothetical protein VNP96_07630 [Solirubrobacterales bacterium]|nr:hypothetical protein [Solirubrobacterales bacterium]
MDDRGALAAFVSELREDLQLVIDESLAGEMLPPLVAERLQPAWESLQERGEFDALQATIISGEHDAALSQAGLSGPELMFKLAGVQEARQEASRLRTPRAFRKLLKWLNVPLKSLLAAIGLGEGINELKEGLEIELDEQ